MTTTLDGVVQQKVGPAVAVGLLTVAAWLAIAAGLTAAAFAATDQLVAEVPVRLTAEAPASAPMIVPCVEGWPADGSAACEPAATADEWRGGEPLPLRYGGGLITWGGHVSDAGAVATLPATVALWGGLIAGGVAALVLVPTVRALATGRLFERGHARRFATAAVVVLVAWLLATAGPFLAAPDVIALIEATPLSTSTGALEQFAMPAGWLAPDLRIAWWPSLPVALLAVLAWATRAGTRIAADTEGLV